MLSEGGFAFGPYQLDLHLRRLLRAGTPVRLSTRQLDVLGVLVGRAGKVVSKDELIASAWPGITISENSVEQEVSRLRRILDPGDPGRYIETAARRGYSFVAPVTRVDARLTEADLQALLAPHRAFMDGRAALETLERTAIVRARSTFQHLLTHHANEASFHVGFANACVLAFEMTRTDPTPDAGALQQAATHAWEACRLAPEYAEAWATLGFVLERMGQRADALAALRRSVTIEPSNWRHHLRLASVGWGEERLRAAERTLALLPGCAQAYWFAATVYVARAALDEAERTLDAGLAVMHTDARTPGRFAAVALHWLKGLLCLARGEVGQASAAFERELALEAAGQLYARECCANTWYALGACHLRRGDPVLARAAFDQAIARIPMHAMARAGLALLAPRDRRETDPEASMSVDRALARAAMLVADGDVPGAAQAVTAALLTAPPGNAGWLVPLEPLLLVQRDRAVWAATLARLRDRAV